MPVLDPVVEAAKAKLEAQRLAADEKKRIDQQSIADYLRFETSYMSEQKKAALKKIEIAKRENDRILALNREQYVKGLKSHVEYNKAKLLLGSKSSKLLKAESSITDPAVLDKLKSATDKAGSWISSTFSGFGLNIRSIVGPAGLALLVQQFIKINTQLREADRTIRQISGISGRPYLQSFANVEGSKAAGREATSLYPDISRMAMRYQLKEKDLLQESFQMAFKGRFLEKEVEGKEPTEKDIISRLMEETIGLGQVTGLGRGALQDYYQQMHVGLGVETNKLKVEFKELYDIASELDGPLNNFIANSIKMSQQMILYGFELDSAKVYTKLFADELDKGKTSLTSIVNMITGVENKPGPLAYLASQMTNEQWERLLPGEGVTSMSDPLTQIGALRSIVDEGLLDRLEILMDIAQQGVTEISGVPKEATGPEKFLRQTIESMYLPKFDLVSSNVREMNVQLLKVRELQEEGGAIKAWKEVGGGAILIDKQEAEKEKAATLFSQQGEIALIDTMSWMSAAYDMVSGGMKVVLVGAKAGIMGSLFGKEAKVEQYLKGPTAFATQEAEKEIKVLGLRVDKGEIALFEAREELLNITERTKKRLGVMSESSRDIVEAIVKNEGLESSLYSIFDRILLATRRPYPQLSYGLELGKIIGELTEDVIGGKKTKDFTLEKKHQGGMISGRYLGEEVPILAQAGEEIIPITQVSKSFKPQLDLSVNIPTPDLKSFSQRQDKNLYINVGPFSFEPNRQENISSMIEDAMEEVTKRVKEEYYQAQKFK